ncbi:hypothetical protein CUMW_215990 [Citrus unshiu]|uniref:Cytochrome P450 n=1 Tax=Citrus unshiu TaxID=55188 RepID=A0A2H5QCB3_CITUN|nr:hypothetical protein CUMW_215990 [Citrus unshiu]
MALLVIIIILCLPIFLFLFSVNTYHKNNKKKIKIPPRPHGLPFIGNVHQFDFSKPQVLLWELSKIYGPFISLHLGVVPIIVVSSAEMAKETLKTHDIQFCSRLAITSLTLVEHKVFDPLGR